MKTWIISKSRHLEDIFDEGKLDKDVVVSKMEITEIVFLHKSYTIK